MSAAQQGMMSVLAEGIAELDSEADEESTEALEAGVDALAKCVGPVAGLFKEAKYLRNGTLPLSDDVKQLPPCVFKRLLASEALQLQLEEEAYPLLVNWLWQSPHVRNKSGRLALFKELAPLLRYHHMTTDFLDTVVCESFLMQKSDLLPLLKQAVAVSSFLKEKTGARDRGVGASNANWGLKASFTLEEVAALEPGEAFEKWCGRVAGYPGRLRVVQETEEGDTLGADLFIQTPKPAVDDGMLVYGVNLEYRMTFSLAVMMEWDFDFFSIGGCWGWSSVLGKPWAEAVREGSPHFPGGKLEIKAMCGG